MENQHQDRRGFTRIPFHTEVEVRAGSSIARSKDGFDVSMSGLSLAVESVDAAVFAPGVPCEIRILLSASAEQVPIEARGVIIRSEPGNLAVEFSELDLDSYQHLRLLILNNTAEPEKAEREFASHWGIKPRRA